MYLYLFVCVRACVWVCACMCLYVFGCVFMCIQNSFSFNCLVVLEANVHRYNTQMTICSWQFGNINNSKVDRNHMIAVWIIQKPVMVYCISLVYQDSGFVYHYPSFIYQYSGFLYQYPGFVYQYPGCVCQYPGFVCQNPGFVYQYPCFVYQYQALYITPRHKWCSIELKEWEKIYLRYLHVPY